MLANEKLPSCIQRQFELQKTLADPLLEVCAVSVTDPLAAVYPSTPPDTPEPTQDAVQCDEAVTHEQVNAPLVVDAENVATPQYCGTFTATRDPAFTEPSD